jgi:thiamine-monophosphate kinase
VTGPEDKLVAWLRREGERNVESLLGDDGAVLAQRGEIAVTVDQQIEGVHFLSGLGPAVLARRLLRVNLSDLAAMGARPRHAFLALAAPATFDHRRFFRALLNESRRYGVRLAGGDLAASGGVHMSLTLIGERNGRWLRRSNARPGDRLWLGGPAGESAAGCALVAAGATFDGRRVALPANPSLPESLLPAARRAVRRHLAPEPQLELSRWLASRPRSAAIDVSDGLARDLHRLCRESATGAEIDAELLPMAPRFEDLARRLNRQPMDWALHGGEDYVLLFALPASEAPPAALGATAIGVVTSGRAVRMKKGGAARPLGDIGFDHLAAGRDRPGFKRRVNARPVRRGRGAPRRP